VMRGDQGLQPRNGERKPTVRPRSRQHNHTTKALAQPKLEGAGVEWARRGQLAQLPLPFSPASVAGSMSFEELHRSVIPATSKALRFHGASGG